MKKIVKVFLKTLLIIILLLLVLVIVLPIIFKPQLMEIAKNEINKNVNAKVEFADFKLNLPGRHLGPQSLAEGFIPHQSRYCGQGEQILHLPSRGVSDYEKQMYGGAVEGIELDAAVRNSQGDDDLFERFRSSVGHGNPVTETCGENLLSADHGVLELMTAAQSVKDRGLVNQLPDGFEPILAGKLLNYSPSLKTAQHSLSL